MRCSLIRTAAAVLVISTLASCDTFNLWDVLDESQGPTVTIIPSSVSLLVTSEYYFVASGGDEPYSFEISSGTASVVQVGPIVGSYKPASEGTDIVRVTDARGDFSEATVTVLAHTSLNILPALPVTIQVARSYTFSADGGTPPYSYTLFSGVGSVVGNTYNADGGTGTAVVRVTDSVGGNSDANVIVVAVGTPLGISPASPIVEEGDSITFSAYGGPTGAHVYSKIGAGSLAGAMFTAGAAEAGLTADVTVTDTPDTATTTVTIAPAAPTNLVADGAAAPHPKELLLTWDDNAGGETGYEILRAVASEGVFAPIPGSPTPANSTSFIDSGLSPGVGYLYKVRAVAGAVYSGESNLAFDTPG